MKSLTKAANLLRSELALNGIQAAVCVQPASVSESQLFHGERRARKDGLPAKIRVEVANIPDCYRALGVVHGLWAHKPGTLIDGIAGAETRMVQALRTCVHDSEDICFEIRRTISGKSGNVKLHWEEPGAYAGRLVSPVGNDR